MERSTSEKKIKSPFQANTTRLIDVLQPEREYREMKKLQRMDSLVLNIVCLQVTSQVEVTSRDKEGDVHGNHTEQSISDKGYER